MAGQGKWCCRFCSWYNVGNNKHCGNCGRSWASRGNARNTGKWTCQQYNTVHMYARKKECRTCGAPRKDQTTQKPNSSELWSLIEAESNKIKATPANTTMSNSEFTANARSAGNGLQRSWPTTLQGAENSEPYVNRQPDASSFLWMMREYHTLSR